MRYILITGARDYPAEQLPTAYEIVKQALCQCGTILVHGGARGIDTYVGDRIKEYMLYDSQLSQNGSYVFKMPARWSEFGKKAGPLRNREMVKWIMERARYDQGDDVTCLAFPLEPRQKHSGTWDCIDFIRSNGLELWIYPAKTIAFSVKD